jgi:hypothetical protein
MKIGQFLLYLKDVGVFLTESNSSGLFPPKLVLKVQRGYVGTYP